MDFGDSGSGFGDPVLILLILVVILIFGVAFSDPVCDFGDLCDFGLLGTPGCSLLRSRVLESLIINLVFVQSFRC